MHLRDIQSTEIGSDGATQWMLECEWAPCRHGCPVHADVRAYIEHAAAGDWRGAVDVIRRKLPFASVCGRICHHPCEDNCRRGDVDGAVAIREVKRFVAETQGVAGSSLHDVRAPSGRKVAVIGAGPSGLSAALELAKSGHRPVVFDRAPEAGGIPVTTIPQYRLPVEVVRIDVDWICAHGVELRPGVDVGRDVPLDGLMEQEAFDAALIAVGLATSRTLPLNGADHPRVHPVLDFLQDVKRGRTPDIGDDVVVIGAGNVAMDAARTAVRLGAARVTVLCLESPGELPAYEWEVREAVEEGVGFIHRRGPVEIVRDAGGAVTALKARKVTRVFDGAGRFSPQYDDADVIDVGADTVVFAIGQMPDAGYAAGSELPVDGQGRPLWNPETFRTERNNVFACGEIVTPPGSVVEACASGQKAARAIHAFLSGEPVDLRDAWPREIEALPERSAECVVRCERAPVITRSPSDRRGSFATFDCTYTPDAAAQEARRCMSCGGGAEVLVDKCSACLTCLRVCPFDAPVVTDVARVASEGCQACGICEAECPANAIVMRRYASGDLKRRTADALADGNVSVALIGGWNMPAARWRGEGESVSGAVAELFLASTASISVSDLLYAFECGAEQVIVAIPPEGRDRYPGAVARTRRRVAQAAGLLKEAGIDPSRLRLVDAATFGRDD